MDSSLSHITLLMKLIQSSVIFVATEYLSGLHL